jgi:hypothetical protein
MQLVTHQTGPEGQKVQRVLIEEMSPIERELYLGIVLDRAAAKLVFMASQAGGMEIEEVAAKDPDAIYKAYIDPAVGFQPYQARKLAFALGLKPTQINDAVKFMTGLYKVFWRRTLPCWRSIPSSPPPTAASWPSTARSISTTTPSSATRSSRNFATRRKKIRWKWKPRSTR